MTTPAGPQTNERKYRFKDEWLAALVGTMPGVTPELIKRWRFQEKPYIAQALIDGDVLSFQEIAEVVKEAFRIDWGVDAGAGPQRFALYIIPPRVFPESGTPMMRAWVPPKRAPRKSGIVNWPNLRRYGARNSATST